MFEPWTYMSMRWIRQIPALYRDDFNCHAYVARKKKQIISVCGGKQNVVKVIFKNLRSRNSVSFQYPLLFIFRRNNIEVFFPLISFFVSQKLIPVFWVLWTTISSSNDPYQFPTAKRLLTDDSVTLLNFHWILMYPFHSQATSSIYAMLLKFPILPSHVIIPWRSPVLRNSSCEKRKV